MFSYSFSWDYTTTRKLYFFINIIPVLLTYSVTFDFKSSLLFWYRCFIYSFLCYLLSSLYSAFCFNILSLFFSQYFLIFLLFFLYFFTVLFILFFFHFFSSITNFIYSCYLSYNFIFLFLHNCNLFSHLNSSYNSIYQSFQHDSLSEWFIYW